MSDSNDEFREQKKKQAHDAVKDRVNSTTGSKWSSRKFIIFCIFSVIGLVFGWFAKLGMPTGYFLIGMLSLYCTANVADKGVVAKSMSKFLKGS